MIKFKTIKPFVEEFIVLCFVIFTIFTVFLYTKQISIIKEKPFVIAGIIVIAVTSIMLFVQIVNVGVKALIDFIFQLVKSDNYKFICFCPYEASIFADKFIDWSRGRKSRTYYLIIAEKEKNIYAFISETKADMEIGQVYTLTTTKHSNILIDYISINSFQ